MCHAYPEPRLQISFVERTCSKGSFSALHTLGLYARIPGLDTVRVSFLITNSSVVFQGCYEGKNFATPVCKPTLHLRVAVQHHCMSSPSLHALV
jgi:hypothetical protein